MSVPQPRALKSQLLQKATSAALESIPSNWFTVANFPVDDPDSISGHSTVSREVQGAEQQRSWQTGEARSPFHMREQRH